MGWGSYFDYALAWEKNIDNPNVLIVTYEELIEVKKIKIKIGHASVLAYCQIKMNCHMYTRLRVDILLIEYLFSGKEINCN